MTSKATDERTSGPASASDGSEKKSPDATQTKMKRRLVQPDDLKNPNVLFLVEQDRDELSADCCATIIYASNALNEQCVFESKLVQRYLEALCDEYEQTFVSVSECLRDGVFGHIYNVFPGSTLLHHLYQFQLVSIRPRATFLAQKQTSKP
jgi:hypothetical protein